MLHISCFCGSKHSRGDGGLESRIIGVGRSPQLLELGVWKCKKKTYQRKSLLPEKDDLYETLTNGDKVMTCLLSIYLWTR